MTVDFGNGQNPPTDALFGAQATASQQANLYGVPTAQAHRMTGLTRLRGRTTTTSRTPSSGP